MARILIVDDDPDVVEACRLFLEKAHHTVACAYSRPEGMKAIAEEKPDLLILDVIMEQPDDGIAMAQELRRTGFDAPILMLTSIGRVTGMSFGRDDEMVPVDEFQEKPIDPGTLVRKVAELLAKHEAVAGKAR
jgi:DNA-binding response OmpR family regulator